MSKNHIWMSTYNVILFVTVLPHSGWFLLFPSIFLWISRFLFFPLSIAPLFKYATFSFSTLQLREVASMFVLLQTKLLWTYLNIYAFCMSVYSLDVWPGEELQVDSFQFSWETAILMCKWIHQFALPPEMEKFFSFSSSSPAQTVISVFYFSHYGWYKTVC